jgi:hypothetical protein
LAHWIWGQMQATTRLARARRSKRFQSSSFAEDKGAVTRQDAIVDPSSVLGYSRDDLTRSPRPKGNIRDRNNVGLYLHFRKVKLKAGRADQADRARATKLQLLSGVRLFREALDRIRKGRSSTQQSTP